MTQKTSSTPTSAVKTPATTAPAAAPWPPAGLQKRPTGNMPFFRHKTGDRLWGVKVGSNEALSVPDPNTGVMRHVVIVLLKAPANVQSKIDGELVEAVLPAGEFCNVGVKAQSAPILLQADGTEVALEIGKKVSIDGGKTMYLVEGWDNSAERAEQAALAALPTPPALTSGN